MRIVAALGGNAISPSGSTGTASEMRATLASTSRFLADVLERGVSLVLTHGNGPQIGRILLQQEAAAPDVPAMPMDVAGAESQGQIGYLLAQALDSELRARSMDTRVMCLVTQVVVDGRDRAFRRPTKPVGPVYDRPTAQRIAHETGYVFQIMPGGKWRRVVASPRPLYVVEEQPLQQIIESGHVVICAGGGGVPVVEHDNALYGVEAVIDKDLTAALLATQLHADLLLILTDVERVQTGFGTANARAHSRLTLEEARRLLDEGEFAEGSMAPKVEACCNFVQAGGKRAVIAALSQAAQAAFGDAGTSVTAK